MQTEITKKSTVQETKDFLRQNYEKGCTCPSCGQFVKLYKRKLNSSMARALIILFNLSKTQEWIHSREITKNVNITGDFAKMAYWKLIEEKKKEGGEDKRTSGIWKITERGRQFVRGQIRIPAYVFIYNAKLQGFSDDTATIRDCLGKKFSYSELMNS